jgi:gentisate 1,2-dioxygenase
LTGGHAISTIETHLQLLPAGFATVTTRTTAGRVFSVVEGDATVTITPAAGAGDPARYRAGPKDHFVVPPWAGLEMTAGAECVLFGFSDAPLQEAAGILRTAS